MRLPEVAFYGTFYLLYKFNDYDVKSAKQITVQKERKIRRILLTRELSLLK